MSITSIVVLLEYISPSERQAKDILSGNHASLDLLNFARIRACLINHLVHLGGTFSSLNAPPFVGSQAEYCENTEPSLLATGYTTGALTTCAIAGTTGALATSSIARTTGARS